MNELCEYIESIKFAVMLNVCSGFNCVKHGLELDANVLKLIWELDEWQNQLEVYERIQKLLPIGESEIYENQYDMALTAYLYVLSKCNMPLAVLSAREVQKAPRCFWAYKMAAELNNG
jgi:hypothetical protein